MTLPRSAERPRPLAAALLPLLALLWTAPGRADEAASAKPDLILMTALPIVWGDYGAFDPRSRPAGIYKALQREFAVRPIDVLDAESLSGARLLLLAQPRWLGPEELVALDKWVRAGGRALILADPELDWPGDLPLGDMRRPPPRTLLGPLLAHWGLTLEPVPVRDASGRFGASRRLVAPTAGTFRATGKACRVVRFYYAQCAIGAGRAFLLSDADLMRDDVWIGEGGSASKPRADNPLILADLLDELADVRRERLLASAPWWAGKESVLLAGLGVAGLTLFGLLRRRRTR